MRDTLCTGATTLSMRQHRHQTAGTHSRGGHAPDDDRIARLSTVPLAIGGSDDGGFPMPQLAQRNQPAKLGNRRAEFSVSGKPRWHGGQREGEGKTWKDVTSYVRTGP